LLPLPHHDLSSLKPDTIGHSGQDAVHKALTHLCTFVDCMRPQWPSRTGPSIAHSPDAPEPYIEVAMLTPKWRFLGVRTHNRQLLGRIRFLSLKCPYAVQ
jgi:hypothetical protein